MGIYSAKFALESAADVIQTPDNVGIDLDQIENNIVGPDGIEAHRDDVEDAMEGVVGDPLEEAYMTMFESEYNYNQLMKSIGMAELREASYGRDLMLEAGNIKSFFMNIKKIITNMFQRITTAFKKFMDKMDIQVAIDKSFVSKYRSKILSGGKKKWSAKGYVFPDEITFNNTFKGENYIPEITRDLAALRRGEDVRPKSKEETRGIIIKDISGVAAQDIDGMNKLLIRTLHGGSESKVELYGKIKPEQVVATLSADRETKAIKNMYNSVKDTYKSALKQITEMEKNITAQDYSNTSRALAICEHYTSAITFEKNVQNNVYVISMRAAKEKRAQARALAHKFVKEADSTVQHNSATVYNSNSVFSSIELL